MNADGPTALPADPLLLAPLLPASVEVLEPFVNAGVIGDAEVQLAAVYARLAPDTTEEVLLALAVVARGVRLGHVGVPLAEVDRVVIDRAEAVATSEGGDRFEWPELSEWITAIEQSPIVATPETAGVAPLRPLVWDGERLYLHRYWAAERLVARRLLDMSRAATDEGESVDPAALEVALDLTFGVDPSDEPDLQRAAAAVAINSRLAVVAGGPGTGKTRTVARMIAAAAHVASASHERAPVVALAAPTGKAAARMTEALRGAVVELRAEGAIDGAILDRLDQLDATTLHRLLGAYGNGTVRHTSEHPLPYDIVVVDESSMVDLPMMSRLVDAMHPGARLVLVGDPYQLASVEAGVVLRDIVGPALGPLPVAERLPGTEAASGTAAASGADAASGLGTASGGLRSSIVVLRRTHRFDDTSAIAGLAEAVRDGDVDAVLHTLNGASESVQWVRPGDVAAVEALTSEVIDSAAAVVAAARVGDVAGALAEAGSLKVLAATRHRPFGLYDWTRRIEAGVAARTDGRYRPPRSGSASPMGTPVMVTGNDTTVRVANGDTGVVVHHGGTRSMAMAEGDGHRFVPMSRLEHVEPWWAMTIHKSQGSEFITAVVSLPPEVSPVLSRELLYTAVTRARRRVVVVAEEAVLRAAAERPASRASGLGGLLWNQE